MSSPIAFPTIRMRRYRHHSTLQQLTRETELSIKDFVLPLFIKAGENIRHPIQSMPGYFQISLDHLSAEIEEIVKLGIPGVILFGIPEHKDELGSDAYDPNGIIQQAIPIIKQIAPELLVITDVCFCEYMSHGHCGVIKQKNQNWYVDNDSTLELLVKQAISHVQAGADIVAPSGMMDGMVKIIREALDHAGFIETPILSYAVKYCSALYGPFREAAESIPHFGNRQGYQMDPANAEEAIREAQLDINEGADLLMVKPAGAYLDIIYRIKQANPGIPLAAYQVSGEYAMIKAAGLNGWIDERRVVLETLLAIKRAGANFIISYFAKDVAKWL